MDRIGFVVSLGKLRGSQRRDAEKATLEAGRLGCEKILQVRLLENSNVVVWLVLVT